MDLLGIIVIVAVAVVLLWVLFFWYQNRRARESARHIDHSKLKDLDQAGWDDR